MDKKFTRLLWLITTLGVLSIIVLLVITICFFNHISIIEIISRLG